MAMKSRGDVVRQIQIMLNTLGKLNKGTQEYRDIEMWYNALKWVLE